MGSHVVVALAPITALSILSSEAGYGRAVVNAGGAACNHFLLLFPCPNVQQIVQALALPTGPVNPLGGLHHDSIYSLPDPDHNPLLRPPYTSCWR